MLVLCLTNISQFELSSPSKFLIQFFMLFFYCIFEVLCKAFWAAFLKGLVGLYHASQPILNTYACCYPLFLLSKYCSYQLLNRVSFTYIHCSPVECDLYSTIPDIFAHSTIRFVDMNKNSRHILTALACIIYCSSTYLFSHFFEDCQYLFAKTAM